MGPKFSSIDDGIAEATKPSIEDFFPIRGILDREVPLSALIEPLTFDGQWQGIIDDFNISVTLEHDSTQDAYLLEIQAFHIPTTNPSKSFLWSNWYRCGGRSSPHDFFEEGRGKISRRTGKMPDPSMVRNLLDNIHLSTQGTTLHVRRTPLTVCQEIKEDLYWRAAHGPPDSGYQRNAGRWLNVFRLDRDTETYLALWGGFDIGERSGEKTDRFGIIPAEMRLYRRSLSPYVALFGSPEMVVEHGHSSLRARLGLSLIGEGNEAHHGGLGRGCLNRRGNHVGNSYANLYGVVETRFGRGSTAGGWGFDLLSSGYVVGGFFLENTYNSSDGGSALFVGYRYVNGWLIDAIGQLIEDHLES